MNENSYEGNLTQKTGDPKIWVQKDNLIVCIWEVTVGGILCNSPGPFLQSVMIRLSLWLLMII